MGVDLQKIAKQWNKNGIEAIPQEQIKKNEEAYLLQEGMHQTPEQRTMGKSAVRSILANLTARQYFPEGKNRKRCRKSTN